MPPETGHINMFGHRLLDPELEGVPLPNAYQVLWDEYNKEYPPEPGRFRSIPITALDIEKGLMAELKFGDPDSSSYQNWVRHCIQLIHVVKGAMGVPAVSFYHMPPGRPQNPDRLMAYVPNELLRELDYFFPLCYIHEDYDWENYVEYVRQVVELSDGYGVPVYPLVWGRWFNCPPYSAHQGKLIPQDHWSKILTGIMDAGAAGLALWDGTYMFWRLCDRLNDWPAFRSRFGDEMQRCETPWQYTVRVSQNMVDVCAGVLWSETDRAQIRGLNEGGKEQSDE